MKKELSVIVPVYNRENEIEAFVLKICRQLQSMMELILVDDGSTDETYKILKRHVADNIRVYHKVNEGSGSARNYGISKATGKYILFLDCDDDFSDEILKYTVEYMINNKNCDLLIFGYENKDEKGNLLNISERMNYKITGKELRNNYCKYFYTEKLDVRGALWNKVFCLDIINEHNIRCSQFKRNEDQVFILKYLSYCNEIHFSEKILYGYYKEHDMRKIINKYSENYFEEFKQFINIQNEILNEWNPKNLIECRDKINREIFNNLLWTYRSVVKKEAPIDAIATIKKIVVDNLVSDMCVCLEGKMINTKVLSLTHKKKYFKIYIYISLRLRLSMLKSRIKYGF